MGDDLAREICRDFPRSIVFMGNLVFEKERWFNRLLHNNTAYRLQRRLQFAGLNAMVLPVRVREGREPDAPPTRTERAAKAALTTAGH